MHNRIVLRITIFLLLLVSSGALFSQVPPQPIVPIVQVEYQEAAPGCLISVTEPEYEGTKVHHLLYLPSNYDSSKRTPIIVEYTGNRWDYGDGSVEEALFGYSITLGQDFIWVVLPYIAEDGCSNQELWWGDIEATTSYAKMVVPRIVEKYNGDADNVVLCGFSRGSIAASFIGLHDDQISKLWSAFITHDHFDGQKEWRGKEWGSPLESYRQRAAERLKRLAGRKWLVCSKNSSEEYSDVIESMGADTYGEFDYLQVDMSSCFPTIPNEYVKHPHNDRWPLFDSAYSRQLRAWLKDVVGE